MHLCYDYIIGLITRDGTACVVSILPEIPLRKKPNDNNVFRQNVINFSKNCTKLRIETQTAWLPALCERVSFSIQIFQRILQITNWRDYTNSQISVAPHFCVEYKYFIDQNGIHFAKVVFIVSNEIRLVATEE